MQTPRIPNLRNRGPPMPWPSPIHRPSYPCSVLPWVTFVLGSLAWMPPTLDAQRVSPEQARPGATVLVTPGPQYATSSFYAFFAGSGHRDLWTTPIEVEVVDLSVLAGGLTPLRVGGGMTTATLHAQGADGRRYVFRSVDKDPAKALPDEFLGTPVEALVQDQISAFHPSGAPVVARLLEAVDVLHAEPRLYVMPDDPVLGEFRERFAGMLVLFEERPDEGDEGEGGFGGSDRIVGTPSLFERLREDPTERVDAENFLRARLVDLLVGDRDRSINNWRWARFDEGRGQVWRAIPRDRDQAFLNLNGMVEAVGRLYDPRLLSYEETFPSIRGLTRNAWDMDRTFLTRLDRATWDAVVADVQRRLSNEVIQEAVHRLPRAHYDLIGAELEEKLRSRRALLPQAADELYRIVFGYADVTASDEDDLAVIHRLPDGGVEIRLHEWDDKEDPEPGEPFFARSFAPDETREIRLYLWDGDDRVELTGEGDPAIKIRLVGAGGQDTVEDMAEAGSGRILMYDQGGGTDLSGAPTVHHVDQRARRPEAWSDEREVPDWGTRNQPRLGFGYDADRGPYTAVAWFHKRYGFLKDPFGSRLTLSLAYSFSLNRLRLDYRHEFKELTRRLDLEIMGRVSGMEVIHYHGLSNKSVLSESKDFYTVLQKGIYLNPRLIWAPDRVFRISVGPVLKLVSTDTTSTERTILSDQRPYGSGRFNQAGLRAGVELGTDPLDEPGESTLFLTGDLTHYPSLMDVTSGFSVLSGRAEGRLLPGTDRFAFIGRVGGQLNAGTEPFHEAALLGGRHTLRGYKEARYAGNGMLFANGEVRAFVGRLFVFFPLDLGVFGLADVGRVFVDGESSSAWHGSVGGGLLVAPFTRTNVLTLSLARSGQGNFFYIGTEFGF